MFAQRKLGRRDGIRQSFVAQHVVGMSRFFNPKRIDDAQFLANVQSLRQRPLLIGVHHDACLVAGNFADDLSAAQITFDTTGLIPVADSSGSSEPGISSVDGSVQVTAYGGQQRVDLSVSIPDALPIRYPNGGNVPGTDPHIVISDPSSPPSVTYSVSGGVVTIGTTHVTLSGSAQFSANNYSVAFSTASATGGSVPVFDLFASNITSSGFDVTGFGNGGSGSGTISFNYIAIGD